MVAVKLSVKDIISDSHRVYLTLLRPAYSSW